MEHLPPQIHVGMKVFDLKHEHIGTVEDFKFSENVTSEGAEVADIDPTDEKRETLLGAVADAFGHEDLPKVLRDRMLIEGYVRIDADGLFAADRYVLPSQIASATAEELNLAVKKADLIKRP